MSTQQDETVPPAGESVRFPDFNLQIDPNDRSAHAYKNRDWYEEVGSPFYRQIRDYLDPAICVDIGANIGAVSLILKTVMPGVPLVSVEPNPELHPYLEYNLREQSDWSLIKALVGRRPAETATFSVNPAGSQDSRVIAVNDQWRPVETRAVTLQDLVSHVPGDDPKAYIKIDTQGYEREIFEGAACYLQDSANWLIKTEFAPKWMRSQGCDPDDFLRWLLSRFNVVEFPGRYGYRHDLRRLLWERPLEARETEDFLSYCIGLNRHEQGWVDLLICPRSSPLLR